MRLIMVRHGETYANQKHILDTEPPGSVLTETGWTQANNVVEKLVSYQPDSIWVSNATRTAQTATPLATRLGMEPLVREGLREIAAGSLEGLGDDASIGAFISVVKDWVSGKPETRMGGGVNGYETLQRFDNVVAEIEATGADNAVVFSHGAMLAYWVWMRGRGRVPAMRGVKLNNTDMTILEGSLTHGYEIRRWAHVVV
ncbi:MAG: histidine phosphatase family protein [Actinomycetaceae bacterium]|nr:histidine phosphatase family protein [Actinomycetaceae bacterium]